MTENERRALASELADCVFVKNDTISRRGEIAEALYVLAEGRVAIYGDADRGQARPRLATLEAPTYFGEMGVLTGQALTIYRPTLDGEGPTQRIGTATVVSVHPQLSVVRIDSIKDAVFVGDFAAIHRITP